MEQETNIKLEAEIQDLRAKIEGVLKDNNGKDLEYYDKELEKKEIYIAQEWGKLLKFQEWLAKEEQKIQAAKYKREKLQYEALTFDSRAPSNYINNHNRIYSNNETWIYSLEKNRQSIIDRLAISKANIGKKRAKIGKNEAFLRCCKGLKTNKGINEGSIEKFERRI